MQRLILLLAIAAGIHVKGQGPLLPPGEDSGKIYDVRGRWLERDGFRLNGQFFRARPLLNQVLLNHAAARPFALKFQRQNRVTLALAGGGLILTGFMLAQNSRSGPFFTDAERYRMTGYLAGAIVLETAAGVVAFSRSRNFRNSINAFNRETLLAPPGGQLYPPQAVNEKIIINVNHLGGAIYYRGKTISRRRVDEMLSNHGPARPYLEKMNRNKKIARIAGWASMGFLVLPIAINPGDLGTPMNEHPNAPLVFASLGCFAVALTTAGIAGERVQQYRYNAIKTYNGEVTYPFRRKDRPRRQPGVTLGLGTTPNGVGLLARF